MTTKYELTDADRKRLDAIAQEASGKPKVTDAAWEVARDWFATLPVVSHEAAERALGEATTLEVDECRRNHLDREGRGFQSYRYALDCFLANRRAMLDVVEAEPPKAAPVLAGDDRIEELLGRLYAVSVPSVADLIKSATPDPFAVLAGDDLRKRLDWQIREIVRERGARVRAEKDGDVGNRIHWGVASAMTSLYDSLFSRPLDDDLGWNAGFGSNSPEPTPEPQPAIDVVAELAELRRLIDLFRESQAKHQDTTRAHGLRFNHQNERLNDFYRRVNALEYAVQRKPRWRWW